MTHAFTDFLSKEAEKNTLKGKAKTKALEMAKKIPKASLGMAGVVSAGALGAAKIISEDLKTRKQQKELSKDDGGANDKAFAEASARNRAKTLASRTLPEKKKEMALKIKMPDKLLSDKDKIKELDIANKRVSSGKGTDQDRKNIAYAKSKGYRPLTIKLK